MRQSKNLAKMNDGKRKACLRERTARLVLWRDRVWLPMEQVPLYLLTIELLTRAGSV